MRRFERLVLAQVLSTLRWLITAVSGLHWEHLRLRRWCRTRARMCTRRSTGDMLASEHV